MNNTDVLHRAEIVAFIKNGPSGRRQAETPRVLAKRIAGREASTQEVSSIKDEICHLVKSGEICRRGEGFYSLPADRS